MAQQKRTSQELVERIKKLAIISVFAEDEFMNVLVLKGGNALDLVLGVTTRASVDIDLSMAGAFDEYDLDRIRNKLESSLISTFQSDGLVAFDVTLEVQPKRLSEELSGFWGGYDFTFKVIYKSDYDRLGGNIDSISKQSIQIGGKGRIEMDISKFEFIEQKTTADLDGYQIYVYTPTMIVAEKLRAICQQVPEYVDQVGKHTAGRAKDFVDIFATVKKFEIDIDDSEFAELVKNMFEAKRVPLDLLSRIESMRAYHEEDFKSVRDTIRPSEPLKEFGFYFDNVVYLSSKLHSLWHP